MAVLWPVATNLSSCKPIEGGLHGGYHLYSGNTPMMQDWNAYRDALIDRVGEYAKQSPDVVRGLTTINGAAAKTSHLDAKTHELIALAVAVTTRCDGCISIHTKKAVEHGATRGEIAEALGVAIALNAGAALVYSARVMEAHAQLPAV